MRARWARLMPSGVAAVHMYGTPLPERDVPHCRGWVPLDLRLTADASSAVLVHLHHC